MCHSIQFNFNRVVGMHFYFYYIYFLYCPFFYRMIFILHTSVLDLPAGSIGSSHGHSHNHSHHGHSHSHSSPSLHRRRRHSNNDGNHLHSELSSRSLVTTDSDATADSAVVDSGEATSIELSSAPLVLNGNEFKHQQDG